MCACESVNSTSVTYPTCCHFTVLMHTCVAHDADGGVASTFSFPNITTFPLLPYAHCFRS